VRRRRTDSARGPEVEIVSDVSATFPLSAAQRRLWFLAQWNRGTALYNTGRVIDLDGELDQDALARALDALVARHESLRTTFSEIDGEPVQTISATGALPLRAVDLRELPSAARDVAADARCRDEIEQPFDLVVGPLVRALLLRLADDRHRLVVALHHIVTDGWSNEILVRDLAALYEADVLNRADALPQLEIQYVDYSEWQHGRSDAADWREDLAYWAETLTGAPDQLDIVTDRPREGRTDAGAFTSLRLDPDLERDLDALCQRESVTLFMAVLAAFNAVLRVYTGQDDLVIGSASANRDRAQLENVVGFFVNTLALRTNLSGDPTAGELLRRVRLLVLDALAHESLPFDRLVAELRPTRSAAISPLFQAMCVVEEGSVQEIALPALRLRSRPAENDLAKFDITLAARRSDEGLELRLGYAADLFDASRMESMLGHIRNALAALASDQQMRLSELPLLSREEERQLLIEWNGSSSPQPYGPVHELFEAQAARRPKSKAICGAGRSLTYGELNTQANRLARRLRAKGVQRGTRVGLYLERSIELVVGILGVLKAGGAYVPLETTLPASRLAFMVRDAALPLVLTRAALQPAFEALTETVEGVAPRVLCLDAEAVDAAAEDANLGVAVSGDDLAYVIYTSGSTGQPKATEVPHRAIPGFALDVDYARFDATETLLQYSSISWDALTLELWPALLTGGCSAVVAERLVRAADLRRAIAEQKVTTLWMTSSLFNAVVDEDIEALAGLKHLLVGGEALSPHHVRRVVARYPALRVVNGYGPSECTVFSTCQVIGPAVLSDGAAVPIGRPVGDRRVLVLDRDQRLVPPGVVGEVHVGGPAVARGYWQRPALTAERFVPDPYTLDGSRLYRTGDLARWRRDGTLEFVGRVDDQVKVRGFRVELGEVEAAVRACRGVREAVVVACAEVAAPDQRLVGYVVGDADWSLAAMTAELSARVPAYMVPTAWVPLAKLPLNANGKVDRAALPAPSTARPELGGAVTPPRDPVEAAIAEIWAEVLGVTSVGVHDDFFALGGHSLTAGRVLARVRASLGVELPLRALFEAPTVARLAQRASAARAEAHGVPAPPLVPVDRTQPLPLSFAQERLWFLHQLAPHTPVYNVFRCLALRGALDAEALESSWRDLVQRHEALRTRFPRVDGRPVQVIDADVNAPLALVDLTRLPDSRRDAEAQLLADVESRRAFDLVSGPLARATLIRQGANDHQLLVALHHIVCDGWSLDVLLRDWASLYAARCDGRDAELPLLRLQPADFAVWQRECLEGAAFGDSIEYWKQRLSDAPPLLTLPWDRPRPAVQTFEGRHLWRDVPTDLANRLRTSARAAGVTPFVYMLAAFKALLLRYSGQRAPVVGTPVTDRGRVESERLVGFFVDTAVLRTDLSGDPTFAALLERVRATVLEAHDRAVPFEKLIEALQPARDLSSSPLCQVMFVLQNLAPAARRFADLDVEDRATEATTSKFDLTVLVDATSDDLRVLYEYNRNLFDDTTVERFAADYEAVLESAVLAADAHLSELRLTNDNESRALAPAAIERASEPSAATGIHRDFEALAARQPDALAVICESERVSYGELNARANRLARRLRALGVAPETPVGVYLERSVDLVVAFWAVLKAGGAYLPLDPAYPAERIAFVLRDSGAAVVVTHRRLDHSLPANTARILDLDVERATLERERAEDVAIDPSPDSLAYVIYTSGSTGRPKGAQLTHGGLSNLVRAQEAAFGLGPADRVLQFSSPSFDASIFEIVLALIAGGALVLARRERLVPGLELVELLSEHAVTTVVMPPSVLTAVPEGHALPALRMLIVAGEACPPDLVARWAPGRRFFNAYGPTETTVWATVAECAADGSAPPIGTAIPNLRAHVLDRDLSVAPVGVAGELCVGGIALARGYAGRPDLTADRFVPDPFAGRVGARLYRTGDRVRRRADGQIEFLGRFDHQIKLRGFRIELHEIESALREHLDVRDAVVVARAHGSGRRLVAYVVPRDPAMSVSGLDGFLRSKLPEHMVPAAFVTLDMLPLTPNGKLDRDALPEPDASADADRIVVPPSGEVERTIARAWCDVLGLPRVGANDSFFALGGHSLLVAQLQERLQRALGRSLSIVELFQYPTVRALAEHLDTSESRQRGEPCGAREDRADTNRRADSIAVVGMACRVPGAADVAAFWRNVCGGVESITFFSDDDLEKAGVDAAARAASRYVKAGGVLAGVDLFDASFFGFTPRDAERTDPQHRLLIECAWEALEHAGCAGSRRDTRIGVFAGSGTSGYFDGVLDRADRMFGSAADFLATRVSHRLDLRGPSLTVQTACSTSLVAIHLACRSLADRECDVALAGGVSIRLPQTRGYVHEEGGILSPDGHCRAFDARAAGTVGGNGVGLVALKRLEDALADGDTIYAVVRGSALNNDGADKVGFTAPSVSAQAEVIADALKRAQVDAESIAYVEAHGTGTAVGDPIEIAALTQAFRATTSQTEFCALGSVKSNIGHLDAAAGVIGFIKAVLAVHQGVIPPSLHFETPNPRVDFPSTPFFVNTQLRPWAHGRPRRAGVSSFGMGGTNVHVVLEEAPEAVRTSRASAPYLLTLSARTPAALAAAREGLASHLRTHPDLDIADVASTLQSGRATFEQREVICCDNREQALAALEGRAPERVRAQIGATTDSAVVFVFPGQGSQHAQMARGLYETEPHFRAVVDECCELLRPELEFDLRDVLWPDPAHAEAAARRLDETAVTQPALFVIEYALARLWMAWGIEPAALVGHSVGELVAACVAGVFSLDDALRLVAARGALMQALPGGAMIAVLRPAAEVAAWLGADLAIAAINAPDRTVVSGPRDAIDALEARLVEVDVPYRRLRTSHAFHSAQMDPALEPFAARVADVPRHAPRIPVISNLTGDWLTASEAVSPTYWRRHLRETVRFADGIRRAAAHAPSVFLEVGPGRTVRTAFGSQPAAPVLSSLPAAGDRTDDRASLVAALGGLWLAGVDIDWQQVHDGERLRRVALPTYPFERRSYWIATAAARPEGGGLIEEPPCSGRSSDRPDADGANEDAELVRAIREQLALMEQQLELLQVSE
jgi:amino acid adenylation domain-containing protein